MYQRVEIQNSTGYMFLVTKLIFQCQEWVIELLVKCTCGNLQTTQTSVKALVKAILLKTPTNHTTCQVIVYLKPSWM